MIKQYSPKFRMSKSYSLLVTLGNISFSWLVLFLLFLNACILLVCSTKDKHTNAQLNKYWAGNEPCFATAPGGISKKTKSVNSIFRCSWITGSHSATELNWLSMLKNVFNHSEIIVTTLQILTALELLRILELCWENNTATLISKWYCYQWLSLPMVWLHYQKTLF